MSDISNTMESPRLEIGEDKKSRRRSHRNSRRKRSISLAVKHHLNQLLRTQNVYRAGFVLLPLAGFVHVTLTNGVFVPDGGDPVTGERRVMSSDGSTAFASERFKQTLFAPELLDDFYVVAPTDTQASVPLAQLEYTLPARDLETTVPSSDSSEVVLLGSKESHPMSPDRAEAGRNNSKTNTYVVNEGGSLWRTGKRFIDDDVLLDKLIDNLSESGMNVRSVRAGVEFIVNDLGSKGMLVVVEDDGDTYESHIVRDSVSSSVRRDAPRVELPRTASLVQ